MNVLLFQLIFPSELLQFSEASISTLPFSFTSYLILLQLITLKIVSEIRPVNNTTLHCEILSICSSRLSYIKQLL
jgi:hypothetical protein